MARFLTNITELTRLETGQISPHLVPFNLGEAVEAASDRMASSPFIAVNTLARLRACLRRALVEEGVLQPFHRGSLKVDLLTAGSGRER